MISFPHPHAPDRLVAVESLTGATVESSVALGSKPLGKMLAPAHVSIIKYVSWRESQQWVSSLCFCRGEATRSRTPHGLLTGNSQDVPLFTQGMAMTNVNECLSPGSKHCNGTIAVASCGCGELPPVSLLPLQGLSVSVCTRPSRDLFCCS